VEINVVFTISKIDIIDFGHTLFESGGYAAVGWNNKNRMNKIKEIAP
jgi:hypothetical protein